MERYRIAYTDTATNDIAEKFQYIVRILRDRITAERWYVRLKGSLQHELSFLPEKYPLYAEESWHSNGVRLFVTRQDVVLCSIDKNARIVYILGICTAGRNLAAHMEDTQVSK